MDKNYISTVKNVFKSKDEETLKVEYNRLWIELINQFEKNKSITTVKQ